VSGSLPKQYAQVVRKIVRMSIPGGGDAAAVEKDETPPGGLRLAA
jgi:hypothetical protein